MNAMEKNRLSKEAEMQIKALKKIEKWKNAALAISAIGVVLIYTGFSGDEKNLFLGILGIVLLIISTSSAIILNLGLRNGRRNVEKILHVLDSHVLDHGVKL